MGEYNKNKGRAMQEAEMSDNVRGQETGFVTKAEVVEMIGEAMAGIRVYVLESDISAAQDSTKAVVKQAEF